MVGCFWGEWNAFAILRYLSEDHDMATHRHTKDSTPFEDLYTRPRKTLAKNAENFMSYRGRGGQRFEDFSELHV